MMKFLKSKRVLLIAALVTILGWAGITVAEKDVANVVNVVLQDGEKLPEDIQAQKQNSPPTNYNQNFEQEELEHQKKQGTFSDAFNKASRISEKRRQHILYGDATGGGHKHGVGAPCKSEFPAHWDDDTIIKEIEMIAANDNLNWEEQRNGYYVTEQKVGTVKVRVVKARNGNDVITAYPTNVKRNPCPRHANDNY